MGEIALFAGLLVILYLLVTTYPVRRRVKRLKRELRIEQTRSCWGEARSVLMTLVREGKLSPHSATFRAFYELQTFVLRRPEEYVAVSRAMTKTILVRPTGPPPWEHEVETWPREMRAVLARMAEGTGRLLSVHSGMRVVLVLALRIAPFLALHLGHRAYRRLVGIARTFRPLAAMWALSAARDQMQDLQVA